AQRPRQLRQGAVAVAAGEEHLQAAEHPGGDYHPRRIQTAQRMAAAAQVHPVALAPAADMADPGLAEYLHAQLTGQVQVVEIQAVLGALGTAADAAATQVAATALRAPASEVRVRYRRLGTEVDALGHRPIAVRHAEGRGGLLQPFVLAALIGVVGHSEHLPGTPVVR